MDFVFQVATYKSPEPAEALRERLEKEADWLISTKIVEEWNGGFVGAKNKDNSGYAVYPTKAEAVASWREAARKAIGCK